MKSMTGYAYVEKLCGTALISVEIKSYNSRFLDLSVYVPPFLSRLEMKFREICSSQILRGKVDVSIRLKESNPDVKVEANPLAAKQYEDAVLSIARSLGREGDVVPLSLIIAQEGVLSAQKETDIDSYHKLIEPVLQEALTEFSKEREREGEHLNKDLLKNIAIIEKSVTIFMEYLPQMEASLKETIKARFLEIAGVVDEQRVLTETAALLMKYTINEEIVRLQSHLSSIKKEIEENPAPGRKLDFICQEINREINTIGSKNQMIIVGQSVIEAKNALEDIREQARNVE